MEEENSFVCPKCGTNNDITELSLAWVEYRGKLNNEGLVEMDQDQTPVIGDNPDDPETHYFCDECGSDFNEPITRIAYEESLEQNEARA